MNQIEELQITRLHGAYDRLQKKHGAQALNAVYGTGCISRPDVCFVFMNPTARNVAAHKSWRGLRAPWLGTKQVWSLLNTLGLLPNTIHQETQKKSLEEWDGDFATAVYKHMSKEKVFITNLSKATQNDAQALPSAVFEEYLELMKQELSILNPKKVVTFGNQVSSVLLGKHVQASQHRKKYLPLTIERKILAVYPVYYPVGQGTRNLPKALADLKYILM